MLQSVVSLVHAVNQPRGNMNRPTCCLHGSPVAVHSPTFPGHLTCAPCKGVHDYTYAELWPATRLLVHRLGRSQAPTPPELIRSAASPLLTTPANLDWLLDTVVCIVYPMTQFYYQIRIDWPVQADSKPPRNIRTFHWSSYTNVYASKVT